MESAGYHEIIRKLAANGFLKAHYNPIFHFIFKVRSIIDSSEMLQTKDPTIMR